MGKYNYKIYDYSLAGIPKKRVFSRYIFTKWEFELFKKYFFGCKTEKELAYKYVEYVKKNSYFKRIYGNDPNYYFEWEIITPNKIFLFDETGCKKEESIG